MFIAEAPGRHGADRTAIPIYGDATGQNFEMMLTGVGLRREDVFVTNAVLCNPRTEVGTNDSPTREELDNCSHHLESTIRMVWPKVILTMGANALAALNLISPHDLTLRSAVGQPHPWLGFTLFPLYHPSPRALNHRNLVQQTADLRAAVIFARRNHAPGP
jgi:uracil-DNA glycosylase family 4